jgi:hypothetical protein
MVMGALGISAGGSRPDTRDIVQDFVDRVESIVAFEDDGCGRVARENVVEEIERLIGHWMGMAICEQRPLENALAQSHATRKVNLLHQAVRQGIEKCARIEAMIAGIQVKVSTSRSSPAPVSRQIRLRKSASDMSESGHSNK